MEAFLYVRARPGTVERVATEVAGTAGVRRATIVVGDWDVLALVEGSTMSAIASAVLSQVHGIDGVQRTLTAPLVPPDRVGMGFGAPPQPSLAPGEACYVHVRAEAGAVEGLLERLAEIEEVSGVAVTGGRFDLVAEIRQPWELASGTVISVLRALPGVSATTTMVGVAYEEPEEDRDQFSSWT
ncbi:MAG TPA: Lrp/AsnC ligand binding domain-containing protein [Actinomycetota bacterium]